MNRNWKYIKLNFLWFCFYFHYLKIKFIFGRARLRKLKQLDISKSNEDTFHSIVMDTFDTACSTKVKMGGHYILGCHAMDGHKYVCMDDLMMDFKNKECVVYSFGIRDDWAFEDMMASFGCMVYANDPTIDTPTFKYPNIKFKKIGLSGEPRDGIYKTFSEIISENGHTDTKISYLKMDIEGDELLGLRKWLESGSLANVQQIAMEYHVNDARKKSIPAFLATLRDLQIQENFRMFNWEANSCWKNALAPKGEENALAEIVLKRVNPQTDCSKS